jgi:hypothetical protein
MRFKSSGYLFIDNFYQKLLTEEVAEMTFERDSAILEVSSAYFE